MTIALVQFLRASFNQVYSYKTDIEDLKCGDLVVVEVGDSYSVAKFKSYPANEIYKEKATKCIVQKVDIETHMDKLDLGVFDD